MRREPPEHRGWKNIVTMVAGSLKGGQTIITKLFISKEEAEWKRKQSGIQLLLLLILFGMAIGIPLLVGYLIR